MEACSGVGQGKPHSCSTQSRKDAMVPVVFQTLHAMSYQQGHAIHVVKHFRTCCLWKMTGERACELKGCSSYPGYNFWSEIPGTPKHSACRLALLPQGMPECPAAGLSSPPHQGLVHGGAQVKDVVADCQVVLQPEGLQDNPVPHGERQAQLVRVVGWDRRGRESVNFPFSICSATIMCVFIQNSNKRTVICTGSDLGSHTHTHKNTIKSNSVV